MYCIYKYIRYTEIREREREREMFQLFRAPWWPAGLLPVTFGGSKQPCSLDPCHCHCLGTQVKCYFLQVIFFKYCKSYSSAKQPLSCIA